MSSLTNIIKRFFGCRTNEYSGQFCLYNTYPYSKYRNKTRTIKPNTKKYKTYKLSRNKSTCNYYTRTQKEADIYNERYKRYGQNKHRKY